MARLSLFCFFVFTLAAADRWVGLRSGPFEVLSDAGDRAARARLADLVQFRGAVGQVLGKSDIRPARPIRILVLRSAKQAPPGLRLARDAYIAAIPSEGPLPPTFLRDCARILIDSGPRGLSPAMENGLAEVFSTLQIDGSRVTLGAPLPPAERNLDWARMHMLTVLPDYYGKLRVAVHNLEQGVEAEPALRNAFGKTPAQIDKEAEAYLSAGRFATTALRGVILRPEKDFTAMPVPMGAEQAALADLSQATPVPAAATKARVDLRKVRVEADASRKQQESEAKKRDAEQEQRELEALKQKSMDSIQAALEKAQREHPALPPSSGKVEDWWDGPRPDAKIQGLLTQVDCLGKQARLVVEPKDAKPVRLLISDPGKIVIVGGGEKTFGCGLQKPPRNIVVDYFTKPDAKLGTAGEAAVIEFPR